MDAHVAGLREMAAEDVVACGRDVGIDLRAVERQAFCNLSGGAKQKTLIALALASQASLYVLDEPTASLDTQSRRDLFHLMMERTRDATLILCSHRLEEIQQGDGRGPDYQDTQPAMAHGSGTGSTVRVKGAAYKCALAMPQTKSAMSITDFT